MLFLNMDARVLIHSGNSPLDGGSLVSSLFGSYEANIFLLSCNNSLKFIACSVELRLELKLENQCSSNWMKLHSPLKVKLGKMRMNLIGSKASILKKIVRWVELGILLSIPKGKSKSSVDAYCLMFIYCNKLG